MLAALLSKAISIDPYDANHLLPVVAAQANEAILVWDLSAKYEIPRHLRCEAYSLLELVD